MIPVRIMRLYSLVLPVLLTACATSWDGVPHNPVEPTARELPRSKSGNPPFYEVYGVRYHVMNSSVGYNERGIASWYGKKFHGRPTSSGERYDMYAMTAAHKTLPLPTIVRVTNLKNGKSVVVKVNDRGPFIDNRIIDMSYAAAIELDMTGAGTVPVQVEALTGGPARARAADQPVQARNPQPGERMYLQVGAFGEAANALSLANRLNSSGIANVAVHESTNESPALYRVRIGPVASVTEFDQLAAAVERLQIAGARLVVENF